MILTHPVLKSARHSEILIIYDNNQQLNIFSATREKGLLSASFLGKVQRILATALAEYKHAK